MGSAASFPSLREAVLEGGDGSRGCWMQSIPAGWNASSKEGKMGSSFVVGLNICGTNPPKAFSARADLAWDRWLMVSRAFGPKREADSILIFFSPHKENMTVFHHQQLRKVQLWEAVGSRVGLLGPVQGSQKRFVTAGQSTVLYCANFRMPSLVLVVILFRATDISMETEQTSKPINSLSCCQ